MGYYHLETGPPGKPEPAWRRLLRKYTPDWARRFWADTAEVLMVTQVAFSIVLPVVGVLFAFVMVCFLGVLLMSVCTGGRN